MSSDASLFPADPQCAHQELTASNIPLWLSFAACSPTSEEGLIEQQIETARRDEGVTDGLFAVIDHGWTFDGTTQTSLDIFAVGFVVNVVRALRDPQAFTRLDALVWRALPSSNDPTWFGFSTAEADAGMAIACIQSPEAQTEAQNIVAAHPNATVRDQVTAKLHDQLCAFYNVD